MNAASALSWLCGAVEVIYPKPGRGWENGLNRGPQPQAERLKNVQSSRCVFAWRPCLLNQTLLLFPGQLSGLLWAVVFFLPCRSVSTHLPHCQVLCRPAAVEGCRGAWLADVLLQVAVCPCRRSSGAEQSAILQYSAAAIDYIRNRLFDRLFW